MSETSYNLHEALGYQISRTARLLERGFETELKRLGLTRITWCILLAAGPGGMTQPSDIAEFIGIDRTATSRALRQLEAAGMVARKGGENDKRTTQVVLTNLANTRLETANIRARENAAHFEKRLTPEENRTLRMLLAKLREGEEGVLPRL